MNRRNFWMGMGILPALPVRALLADDTNLWQAEVMQKLKGRWSTNREEEFEPGKIVRRRIDLEFGEGQLTVSIFDDKDTKEFSGDLKIKNIEEVGTGIGRTSLLRLLMSSIEVVIYFDYVGNNLIIVGRVGPRPWEGFHLSGEYRRPVKSQ